MSPIRLLIADDHAIVRAGIRLLLETQEDMAVVGEAADGTAAIQLARELHPDVLLMDIAMPGLNGLEATRHVRREAPQTQVLVLTMHENERYFYEALRAGASGYVVKGAPPVDLLAAIRAVAQGQAYLQPSLARTLLDDYVKRTREGEDREQYDRLTDREREVLRLIAEGQTAKEVADLLGISANTVERHRANIMAKLDLHTRAALVKYAIRKGLIELEG